MKYKHLPSEGPIKGPLAEKIAKAVKNGGHVASERAVQAMNSIAQRFPKKAEQTPHGTKDRKVR